jgi:hypothetical protein
VIDWFCDRSSAETAILQVMLRWRLRSAGLVRSELKWLASEIAHLRALAHSYFTECQAPDIAAVNAQEWLSTVLRERRHYNPLSWAMALAFSGDVSSKTLSREYDEAVARKPDADMFDAYSRRPRRNSAPASVYAAFASADYKSQAVERSGLTDHEINGWLRKDQHLRIHWTSTRSARRRTNAIKQIRAFTAAWPAARRGDVLRERTQAFRWLERNDPAELSRLLPRHVAPVARHMSFSEATAALNKRHRPAAKLVMVVSA